MNESFGEALRRLRGDISLRQLAVKVNYKLWLPERTGARRQEANDERR
ncbi:MAG TPA: hypothetical protein VFC19_42395 [Candidatus Limnocylindrales bacterium]|nr:hypothetical protein [Candidatus Limnocylindrales bacterium]